MKNIVQEQTTLQNVISLTLRSGVFAASAIGIVGGVLYMLCHGAEPVSFGTFIGTESPFSSSAKLLSALQSSDSSLRALAVVQIGILVLLLTPITRVALSIVGFALERDRLYVLITTAVLLTLLTSVLLH
jgi:uncharacterized membrane protein